MIQDFALALRKQLREEAENYTSDIVNGQPRTIEDYKYLVGQIRGLRIAEERLMDLLKKAEADYEDE